jgi:hypothetical protein
MGPLHDEVTFDYNIENLVRGYPVAMLRWDSAFCYQIIK